MRRDFIFLVRNIPPALHTFSDRHYFATVDESVIQHLLFVGESTGFPAWATKSAFSLAVVRNDLHDGDEAVKAAFESMGGICDMYSLLGQHEKPDLSPMVLIRNGGETDATAYMMVQGQGLIHCHSPDGAAEQRWEERNLALINHFLPLLRATSRLDPSLESEVVKQARLAAKMFHYGSKARSPGIEFLCKMSALEGIVCGSIRDEKVECLRTRLSALFKGSNDWRKLLGKLYDLRSRASHQSLAFSTKFVQANADADFLMTGTMVFVSDHIGKIGKLDDLWALAPSYQLPSVAVQEREFIRGRVDFAKMETSRRLSNIGPMIDSTLESLQKRGLDSVTPEL